MTFSLHLPEAFSTCFLIYMQVRRDYKKYHDVLNWYEFDVSTTLNDFLNANNGLLE